MGFRGANGGGQLRISLAHTEESGVLVIPMRHVTKKIRTLPGSMPDSYIRHMHFRFEMTPESAQLIQVYEESGDLQVWVDGRTFPISRLGAEEADIYLEVSYEARMRG